MSKSTEQVLMDTTQKITHWENRTIGAILDISLGPFNLWLKPQWQGFYLSMKMKTNNLTHMLAIENNFGFDTWELFFPCGTNSYLGLPANWTGTCTLVHLAPEITITPNNQSVPIPLATKTRTKWVIKLIPLLVGLGVITDIDTKIRRLTTTVSCYQKLSRDLADRQEKIRSIVILQKAK